MQADKSFLVILQSAVVKVIINMQADKSLHYLLCFCVIILYDFIILYYKVLHILYLYALTAVFDVVHYYINFTGGGRFRFSAAGKAVRRGLEATINRGLTTAGGLAHRG